MVAGMFSAWGLAVGPVRRERSRTVLATAHGRLPEEVAAWSSAVLDGLELDVRRAAADLPCTRSITAECRYAGQTWTLPIAVADLTDLSAVARSFHDAHSARFGYRMEADVEVTTLRVAVSAERADDPTLAPGDVPAPRPAGPHVALDLPGTTILLPAGWEPHSTAPAGCIALGRPA
jgi:N-methylhydantoinase A